MRWDMFSCLHSLGKTISSAFNQATPEADHQPELAALFTDRHFESYLIIFTVCSVSVSTFALTLLTPPFYSLTHCVCLSKTSQGALPVHSDKLFCGNTLILNMTAHCYCRFGLLLNWSMLYWSFHQLTCVQMIISILKFFCFEFGIFDFLSHRRGTTLNPFHTCPRGTSLMYLLAPILSVIHLLHY